MKPFHLQVQRVPESRKLQFQWFGQSAIHPEGSRELPLSSEAIVASVPDTFVIDLNPLLAEIASGAISDEQDFQAAAEFLLLRDLLAEDDFDALSETLYLFLWREAQTALPTGIQRGDLQKVWSDPDRRLVRVWFATHRKPVAIGDIGRGFDSEESVEEIIYGQCNVFIPESQPGSTGTPWWRRWLRFEADDRLQVRSTHGLSRDIFWEAFVSKLQKWWEDGERNAFVLIHGYNVSFDEAAIRAAQIGYDLKIPGEMAFYSWPSRGSTADYSSPNRFVDQHSRSCFDFALRATLNTNGVDHPERSEVEGASRSISTSQKGFLYLADEATITASFSYIAQFLRELSEKSGAERIHLFVHSMGNRGFLSALERLVAEDHPRLRLGQIFFCAPDEDVRTFTDKVTKFPHQSENRPLLVSPNDKAVAMSKWAHKHERVGIAPPVITVEGIETIEVRGLGLLDLGHGYFASAAPVIQDIREAIETGKGAKDRKIPQDCGTHFAIDIQQNQ